MAPGERSLSVWGPVWGPFFSDGKSGMPDPLHSTISRYVLC